MIKILHIGDVHLESSFANCKDFYKAKNQRNKQIKLLFDTFDFAKQNDVNVVLLAGDLFEKQIFDLKLYNSIKEKMKELEDILFFLSCGNHDYLTSESLYNKNELDNLYIFKNYIEEIRLDKFNTSIYGVSMDHNYLDCNLLKDFKVSDTSRINIMLMHGNVDANNYNSITKEDISNSNLDYLALGHKHDYSGLITLGNTVYCYPGILYARGFDELKSCGFIYGSIEKNNIKLEYNIVSSPKYYIYDLDISDLSSFQQVLSKIESYDLNINCSYQIKFEGYNNGIILDKYELQNYFLDKVNYIEFKDNTKDNIDYDSLANELSISGLFVKNIKNQIELTNDLQTERKMRLALKIGLDILGGKK